MYTIMAQSKNDVHVIDFMENPHWLSFTFDCLHSRASPCVHFIYSAKWHLFLFEHLCYFLMTSLWLLLVDGAFWSIALLFKHSNEIPLWGNEMPMCVSFCISNGRSKWPSMHSLRSLSATLGGAGLLPCQHHRLHGGPRAERPAETI